MGARPQLVALSAETLPAFADLLSSPEFGGCFCAVWCHAGPDWAARCADPARPNLERTRADVLAGRQAGFLVELDGAVVGWTGAGPRAAFPLAETKLGSRLSTEPDAWMIGCLAVAAPHRGRGLSGAIVDAVIARARQAGAPAVQAFPTRPWDEPRSYRGSEALYRRAGFTERAAEPDGAAEILLMELRLGGAA